VGNNMGKFDKYVVSSPPKEHQLALHQKSKDRYLLMSKDLVPESKVFITARWKTTQIQGETSEHIHDVDEIYIIMGEPGAVKGSYVLLDDEKYPLNCPGAVYIPAGVKHKPVISPQSKITKPPVMYMIIMLKGTYP
jgi:hypothetical protein